MKSTLLQFFHAAAARKFAYGEFDCGLWLADWYMQATGLPDPAAHLRGCGCRELPRNVREIVGRLGLARTLDPVSGDIGLVSLVKGHCVGAIYCGRDWVMLGDNGGLSAVRAGGARRAIAWRIP